MNSRRLTFRALVVLLLSIVSNARADEGLWLYNAPPKKQLKERYGFEPTDEWLKNMRLSTVQFWNGTGAFVSANGLIVTNQHIAISALERLSTLERDLLVDGFLAAKQENELKCPGLTVKVLVNIEDVTERVKATVGDMFDPDDAAEAIRYQIYEIENESKDATGLESDVITLYEGARYHLYRYKIYNDVRMVFAPELAIGAFGGDPDNFEYPRFDMDVAFLRAYENGMPARSPYHLKWNSKGPKDGDLVFATGCPGSTKRLVTMAHMEHMRDLTIPASIDSYRRVEVSLTSYARRRPENRRRAFIDLRRAQNVRKGMLGMLSGLHDPVLMKIPRKQEEKLRLAAEADPKLAEKYANAMKTIKKTLEADKRLWKKYCTISRFTICQSNMFYRAMDVVFIAKYPEHYLSKYGLQLKDVDFVPSEYPWWAVKIDPDMEAEMITCALNMYIDWIGFDDPLVQDILDGKSPAQRAAALVKESKLGDVDYCLRLAKGGNEAVANSADPLIRLALVLMDRSDETDRQYAESVTRPQSQAYTALNDIRLAAFGNTVAPDATRSLRLSFGKVAGYADDEREVAPFTTFAGLYRRAEERGFERPYSLPARWMERKERLNLDTPFIFTSTVDHAGGNSGSPVVNRDGEVVGVFFDGNSYARQWHVIYDDRQGRALAVHSAAIAEALRKIYDANRLADELENGAM